MGKKNAKSSNYESIPLTDPNATSSILMQAGGAESAMSFQSPFDFGDSDAKSPQVTERYKSIFTYNRGDLQSARSTDPRGHIHLILTLMGYSIVVLLFPLLGWFSLKRVKSHERLVVFRFGRLIEPKGPGMVAVLPLVDKCEVVSLANKAFAIPPSMIHCEDGGIVEAGGEVIFRVLSPVPAVTEVCDRDRALRNLCQATLRTVVGKFETERIDKLRPDIIRQMTDSINDQIRRWGIEVSRVDLVGIKVLKTPPSILQRFNISSLGQHLGPMLAPLLNQVQHADDPAAAASALASCPILIPPPEGEAAATSASSDPLASAAAESPTTSVEWLLEQTRLKLCNEKIRDRLEGAVFCFLIDEDEAGAAAAPTRYCIDGRSGFVGEGDAEDGKKPDVTLKMARSVLMELLMGDTSPTAAYMSGEIEVKGELKTAMRLQVLNS